MNYTNKRFVYVENGVEKDSIAENRRRNEILEHNKKLAQGTLFSNTNEINSKEN